MIEELASARAAVEGWPGARPHVEKKRIAIESVGHLGDVVSEYFSACIESTTGDAQARMALGQRSLDLFVGAHGRLRTVEEPVDDVDYSTMESFTASTLASALDRANLILQEVIDSGPRLDHLFGVEPAGSLHLNFVLASAAMGGFNEDEFTSTFAHSLAFFRANRDRLVELSTDVEWHEASTNADIVTANGAWQTRAGIEHSQSAVQSLNVAANLMVELVEGPGAFIARTVLLLSGTKQQPMSRLKEDCATTHIDKVASLPDFAAPPRPGHPQPRTRRLAARHPTQPCRHDRQGH